MVQKRIFGLHLDVVKKEVGEKLHSEGFHKLYSSPSIVRVIKSRRMRRTGHVERMGEKRNTYRILMGNPEVKVAGNEARRLEDNIQVNHKGVTSLKWTGLIWL
jgi:hypothetical protein